MVQDMFSTCTRWYLVLAITLLVPFLFWSCSESTGDELVVYSGRSQALVDGLVQDFREQTGINIKVRYGNDAELLAVLNEEGDKSPADVIWANTTGALSNATENDLLEVLPDSLLNKPAAYASDSGKWVPVTVRFRVMVYNPDRVDQEDLPESVMDLPSMKQFEGRIGWTPTYSSFYDFITAMRITKGTEVTREWLQDMQALNPKSYNSNTPMVQAVGAGEIDIAITNHYYPVQMKYGGAEGYYEGYEHYGQPEPDPDARFETYHFTEGDIGNLALVTGAGQLKTAEDADIAQRFLSFLLSRQAQQFAAESVNEYPVIKGVSLPDYLLDEAAAFELSPDYDYEQLQQLEETLNLMREVGLI